MTRQYTPTIQPDKSDVLIVKNTTTVKYQSTPQSLTHNPTTKVLMFQAEKESLEKKIIKSWPPHTLINKKTEFTQTYII